jgi:hypothetical protein
MTIEVGATYRLTDNKVVRVFAMITGQKAPRIAFGSYSDETIVFTEEYPEPKGRRQREFASSLSVFLKLTQEKLI